MSGSVNKDIRWIVIISSIFVIFATGLCLSVVIKYNDKPDYLSGLGQVVGALFAFWAVIGLVASQVFQYRVLELQRVASRAQNLSLAAQLDAAKAANLTLANESLRAEAQASMLLFERYARTLLVMNGFPETGSAQEPAFDGSGSYSQVILDTGPALAAILQDIETGTSRSIAAKYVNLFESLKRRADLLFPENRSMNVFELTYSNTSIKQLYVELSGKFRVEATSDQASTEFP